jgi:hypothetical protein
MDASQWLTVLGLAGVALGLIFTLLSLNHVIRTSNTVEDFPTSAMTNAIRQVLREEADYQTAARRIDEIERRYVVVAKGASFRDLRRLAARIAFDAAIDKGASFEEISTRYQRTCELGFLSIRSELVTLVQFAYACLEYGNLDEGLRVLALARERLPAVTIDSQQLRLSVLIERCRKLLLSSAVR